jgi:hypothetical protein
MIIVLFVAGDQDACHCRGFVRHLLVASADLQRPTVHLPRNQQVRITQIA